MSVCSKLPSDIVPANKLPYSDTAENSSWSTSNKLTGRRGCNKDSRLTADTCKKLSSVKVNTPESSVGTIRNTSLVIQP